MTQRFQTWSPEDVVNFQLFISGNEKGFTYLYKQLYKPSLYFASRMLEDNLEIDCIIHDAFLFVWRRRDKLENLMHFYLSIRLFIKWGCIRYRTNNWRRNSRLLDFHKTEQASGNETESRIPDRNTEELLTLLEKAILYLPATQRNIIELCQSGLSNAKISKHLGVSAQKITSEVNRSIAFLKLILPTLQKAHQAGQKIRTMTVVNYEVYLNKRQARICTLYYKDKQSFSAISQELGLTPLELLKEHYAAMNILNSIKTIKL